MNKALNKVSVRCILYTIVLALPFAVMHYLAVLGYMKNGSMYYELILEIIQLLCTVALAMILRIRSIDLFKENGNAAGKYSIIFTAAFLLVLFLYLTNTFMHICYRSLILIFHDTSSTNKFGYVFLERMLRGELFTEIMLCLAICFSGNVKFLRKKNQVV